MAEQMETPAVDVQELQASLATATDRVERLKAELTAIDRMLVKVREIEDVTICVPVLGDDRVKPAFTDLAAELRAHRDRIALV